MTKLFFGILDHDLFLKLSLEEKIKTLIDKKIITTKESPFSIKKKVRIKHEPHHPEIEFLDAPIEFENILFFFSEEVLEEVLEEYKIYFNDIVETKNEFNLLFEEQLFYYPNKELEELESGIFRTKRELIRDSFIFELNKTSNHQDIENHFAILKSYLIYDYNAIYYYLTGKFDGRCYFVHRYDEYLSNELEIYSLNNFNKNYKDFSKLSLPRKLALLYDLGFFNLDEFKKLRESQKHKIIAYIFGVEHDNKNKIAEIRRNLATLNPDSTEDTTKYTITKFINKTLKELLN